MNKKLRFTEMKNWHSFGCKEERNLVDKTTDRLNYKVVAGKTTNSSEIQDINYYRLRLG